MIVVSISRFKYVEREIDLMSAKVRKNKRKGVQKKQLIDKSSESIERLWCMRFIYILILLITNMSATFFQKSIYSSSSFTGSI